MKEYTTKVDSLSEKESIRSEEEQSASETKPIVFGKSDLKYGGGRKGMGRFKTERCMGDGMEE